MRSHALRPSCLRLLYFCTVWESWSSISTMTPAISILLPCNSRRYLLFRFSKLTSCTISSRSKLSARARMLRPLSLKPSRNKSWESEKVRTISFYLNLYYYFMFYYLFYLCGVSKFIFGIKTCVYLQVRNPPYPKMTIFRR